LQEIKHRIADIMVNKPRIYAIPAKILAFLLFVFHAKRFMIKPMPVVIRKYIVDTKLIVFRI